MTAPNLETLHIACGSHSDRSNGLSVMEVVAWLANEPHSDNPQCACPVISGYARILNDCLGDEDRQQLKSYIPRFLNTKANLDIEIKRANIASEFSQKFAKIATERAGKRAAKYAEYDDNRAPKRDAKRAARYARYAACAAERAAECAEYAAERAAKHNGHAEYAEYAAERAAECAEYAIESAEHDEYVEYVKLINLAFECLDAMIECK